MNDAAATVIIANREYPLKLSVNAMQRIKSLYGDVDEAVDKLNQAKTTIDRLVTAARLASILATEGARAFNFEHPTADPIPDLPEEIAGTVITVADLSRITPVIIKALNEGMGREVFSEADEKNTPGA